MEKGRTIDPTFTPQQCDPAQFKRTAATPVDFEATTVHLFTVLPHVQNHSTGLSLLEKGRTIDPTFTPQQCDPAQFKSTAATPVDFEATTVHPTGLWHDRAQQLC